MLPTKKGSFFSSCPSQESLCAEGSFVFAGTARGASAGHQEFQPCVAPWGGAGHLATSLEFWVADPAGVSG